MVRILERTRRQGSMESKRKRSDKGYKVKNLDAVLTKISSGCTKSCSESKVMHSQKIGAQKTDGGMEHHCFSVPRRLIVRTGLENPLSSTNDRSFQLKRVHSSVDMETLSQTNIITKNKESTDTGNNDCDTVEARRKLLDAYLYKQDELHNCEIDIPSALGINLEEEFVVVHQVEPTTCICDICRKSFTTKKSLVRHRKNVHRNNLAENNPWKANPCNHKATNQDSSVSSEVIFSGNEDSATHLSQVHNSFHQNKKKYSNLVKCEETTFLKQNETAKNRGIATNGSKKQLNKKKSLFDSSKKVNSYPSRKEGESKEIPSVKMKCYSEMNSSSEKKVKSAQESVNISSQTESVASHVCKYCAMAFRNLKSLNRHIPVHTQTKYHCYKCNELFMNMRSLTKHLLLHRDDSACENPLFRCTKCFKEFQNEVALDDHALSHSMRKIDNTAIISVIKNDEVKVSEDTHCNACKLFFDSHASFSKHVNDKHVMLGDTSMQCDKCRQIFQSESKVFLHLIEYHHVSSREARAILRQKDASAVSLGVNASINETMFNASETVKRLNDSNDKNSADVSEYSSKSDLPLSCMEPVSLTNKLATLADQNNDIKEIESGSRTDNDGAMDGVESCFLEEQESKQILEALFLEVEEQMPNPEENENIEIYHAPHTTDSTAVLNFDNYLNHDHEDEGNTSKFTKLVQEKLSVLKKVKASTLSEKKTVEDFYIYNGSEVNDNIKDIPPNISVLSLSELKSTGHVDLDLPADAVNMKIGSENSPKLYADRKNSYDHDLKEESMVSGAKETHAVKVTENVVLGRSTTDLMSSCIELDHLNTVKPLEQFLPDNKLQFSSGNPSSNLIPKTTLLYETEEKTSDNQNTFADEEIRNNRDTANKKGNYSGSSMSGCFNVSKEESVSDINGFGNECVQSGQPLSSLIYRRRRAAIASENKIHYSELPKTMKCLEPGTSSIPNPTQTNSKELDTDHRPSSAKTMQRKLKANKPSQTTSQTVDVESCLKKSRVVIQDELQDGSKAFQCNLCKNAVKKKNSSNTQDQNSKQRFLCAKIAKAKGNLKRHTENIKNETRNVRKKRDEKLPNNELLCNICGKGFNSVSILRGNLTRRQNNDEADMADSVTTRMRPKHLCHKSSEMKECEVCGRTFKRYYNLMMHKKVHEKGQLMISNVCHRDDDSLKRRTLKRSEGKLFRCHVCHSQYKSKEKLRIHKRKCNVATKQCQKKKKVCKKSAK